MSDSEYSHTPPSSSVATPPTSPGVDADAVQRAKREIQAIVQQIAELSRSDVAPDRYYDEFLNKVVSALAAVGGAVWTQSEAGGLQLGYQINLRKTGLVENPIAQEQHGRLLHRVMTGEEGAIIAPQSGFSADGDMIAASAEEHAPANATDYLLVMAPVHNDQGPQGVVEVFQRPGARSQVQQGYLRFLLQTCQLAGDHLRSRRLSHLADKQSLWEQLETFTRTAHERLDVRQASYTIANEGRRLVGADRVTVAVGRGARPKIEAISGQDTFDTRSNVSTLLTKLARSVAKTGEDVWYTGDTSQMAPQVEKALDAYVDESQTKAMAILPLVDRRGLEEDTPDEEVKREGEVIGAIVVEQMVDNQIPEGFSQRVDVVRTHSETALANALEHEGLFLMPLWKALGKATWIFRRRTLPKTVLITAAIVGAICAVTLIQKDFTLEGDGKVRPAELHNVFASIDGTVKRVLVEHEQSVSSGEVVVELENNDLEKDLAQTRGELNQALTELNSLKFQSLQQGGAAQPGERERMLARRARLTEQVNSLEKELDLLAKKQQLLSIRSPIAGQVITYRVEEKLRDRPLGGGEVLMEIADPTGDWVLEVEMPEKRMGHISEAIRDRDDGRLPVEFILATNTEKTFQGWLTKENISASAEVKGDSGNTVLLTVEFDQEEFDRAITDPKVGSEVKAKVACGQSSIAYAYLHDLVDFIRAKILFRL